MKKFIPTYIILALFVGILVYYQVSGKQERPGETTIFQLGKDTFRELSLNSKEKKWKLVKDGEWEIVQPNKWEADQGKVESILEKLSNLVAERVVEKSPQDIEKYGLNKPSAEISFQAGGKLYKLLVGKRSPISYQFYVKRADSPVVYVLSGYTLDKVTLSPQELRERRIIKLEKEKVRKIALTSPAGKIVLEKKDGRWQITSPVETAGDEWEIEDMIDAIKSLRVKKFVEDEAKDISSYGLDKPALKVELWLGKSLVYKSVSFGKTEDDTVYAMKSGRDAIYAVDRKLQAKINKSLFALRDKNMLSFNLDEVKGITITDEGRNFSLYKEKDTWEMKKPEEKKIEKEKVENVLLVVKDLEARSFLEEQGKNLDKYGLSKPSISLTITLQKGEKTLLLGKVFKDKQGEKVYAKVSDKPQVFSVNKYVVDNLKEKIEELNKKDIQEEKKEGKNE
ncbi:MAG: DUF4340 domain-containing protein [Caldiserica bacterium]|nr:DUF4340 domain-containing protein [Caldisericota bacterium]